MDPFCTGGVYKRVLVGVHKRTQVDVYKLLNSKFFEEKFMGYHGLLPQWCGYKLLKSIVFYP